MKVPVLGDIMVITINHGQMGSAVIMPQPKGINTIARLIGHREQNSIHQQILAKVGSRFFDDTVPGRLQSSLSVPIEAEVGAAMFMDVNQLIQWSLKAMFLNPICFAQLLLYPELTTVEINIALSGVRCVHKSKLQTIHCGLRQIDLYILLTLLITEFPTTGREITFFVFNPCFNFHRVVPPVY